MKTTISKQSKNKKSKISGTRLVLPIYNEQVEAELSDGYFGDDETEIRERLIRLWTKIYKKRGYKNFELEFV